MTLKSPHPMASLEFNDPVEWKIIPQPTSRSIACANGVPSVKAIKIENPTNKTFSVYQVNNRGNEYGRKELSKNTYFTYVGCPNSNVPSRIRVKLNGKNVGEVSALASSPKAVRIKGEAIEAGPIFNQSQATQKCNALANQSNRVWTGAWWTTVQGKMSVCELYKLEKRNL